MPFLGQFDFAKDNFNAQKTFTMAACKVAVAVQAETLAAVPMPVGTTLTSQQVHDRRSQLAFEVLRNPEAFGVLFAFACIAQGTLTVAATDAQIEASVAATWNALAISGVAL